MHSIAAIYQPILVHIDGRNLFAVIMDHIRFNFNHNFALSEFR